MDKRNLIFIFSLFITLFCINQYFTHEKALEYEVYKKELADWEEKNHAHIEQEVAGRLAAAEELPLVLLSTDRDTTAEISAVQVGEQVLVIDETKEGAFYLKGKKLSTFGEPREGLRFLTRSAGDKPKAFKLPALGTYDLQMVTSDGTVTLAVLQDGTFTAPLDIPESDAIALTKLRDSFVPIGFYRAEDGTFTTTKELLGYKDAETLVSEALPQQYYLLENEYQQLVFSNIGGALVEINLPFFSEKNHESVVRPIAFDRDFEEKHAANAFFPAHPVLRHDGSIQDKGVLGGYYPLIRRDLIADDGQILAKLTPPHYALNIVSSYPEVAELSYKVTHFDHDSITFEATQPHRRITKTYSLPKDKNASYVIDLTVKVDGDSRGLWLTSGVPEVELVSGSPSPSLKSRISRNGDSEVEGLELPKEITTVSSSNPDWICNSNGFMGVIMDPLGNVDAGYRSQKIEGGELPSRIVMIDQEFERFQAENFPGYQMMLPLSSSGGVMEFRIFAGPFADATLKMVDAVYTKNGYNPDYISSQSFHGWFSFISAPFSKLLFILLNLFHTITNSWAFSIVLLTIVLRATLYPLNSWSMRSMRRMQKIAPEVQAIQAKFKKDPKRAQIEVMNLYREKGANPMMGCFPMLIQMPFLIGMFDLLKSSFELRGAPFIPGWIDNLTAPDVLFNWGVPLPFFGSEFHLLPLLLGGIMYVQQKISNSAPKDVSKMTEQQRQQKAMGNMMTIMFAVMFYHFPSGLNIYWLSSMGLGILQQWFVNRQLDNENGKPVVIPAK